MYNFSSNSLIFVGAMLNTSYFFWT